MHAAIVYQLRWLALPSSTCVGTCSCSIFRHQLCGQSSTSHVILPVPPLSLMFNHDIWLSFSLERPMLTAIV